MAEVYYGETDRTKGLLTYETTQTETEFTIVARSQLQAKTYYQSGYRINTKLSNAVVSTKLGYASQLYTNFTTFLDTGDYSKVYSKTHSAQSIVLKSEYYGEATGGYVAGTKSGDHSVTISIPAKSSYTISYNANGGSGAPSSQTKWYGETLTLSSIVPTRTNYAFKGWATSSSATTAQYQTGGTYTANSAATLYAVWELNGYTVQYNRGTVGTGANVSDTKIYGVNLILAGAIFTRANYTQTGWATTDGGSQAYALNGTYSANASITLYPVWTANTYTVTYNGNGSGVSNVPANQTKTYGVSLKLTASTPTRADVDLPSYRVTYNANGGSVSTSYTDYERTQVYTFDKWNTIAGGMGTSYNPSDWYTVNESVTLYAQWQTAIMTDAPITLPTPTRSGYTFAGWYTSASGGTSIGGAGASYTPTKSITVYAHWTANTYTISYNKNAGNDTVNNMPSSQTKTQDVDLILRSNVPRRTDYIFDGWATSSSGSVTYHPSDTFRTNAATTLYAKWSLNYSEPSITGSSGGTSIPAVYRCDSSGNAQDDGKYIKVVFKWSTFSSNFNATQVKVEYKRSTASSWTTGYTDSSPNASSGTVTTVIGSGSTFNTNYTYNVRITVTDDNGSGQFVTFVSSAFIPIDVGTARKSLGFGMSAIDGSSVPDNGRADFGMDVYLVNEAYLGSNSLKYITYQNTGTSAVAEAGWRRIARYDAQSSSAATGTLGAMFDIAVSTSYQTNAPNCFRKISFLCVSGRRKFIAETSAGSANVITKIRYTTDGSGNGYIDVYVNTSLSIYCFADFVARSAFKRQIFPIGFDVIGASPSGETIQAEYTFSQDYNYENDLYYNAGDTFSLSDYTSLVGAVAGSAKTLYIQLPVPKSLKNITTISATTLKGRAVGVNGLIDSSTLSTDWTSGYTVTLSKASDNLVTIKIEKSTAFGNTTTATPMSLVTDSVVLSFS